MAAVGQFYSNPKMDVAKDQDYRYMPNVISSAIADIPETDLIADMLNKRNTVHHMDSNTDEDVIPIFTQDVNGKPRNNKRLLPRRNWCSIREYKPGSTPPDTPESEMTASQEPRPGMLQRTLSLGRGDKGATGPGKPGLLRRLSTRGSRPPPTRTMSFSRSDEANFNRRASVDNHAQPIENGDSYFPTAAAPPGPGSFHRRPTNLSQKAAKKASKAGDDGAGTFVNLEGGLAITLNLEISPADPAGITAPYKLLVPALRYNGTEYDPPPTQIVKGWRKFLPRRNKRDAEKRAGDNDQDDASDDDEQDAYEDHDLINNTRANAATSHPQYPHYEGYPGSEEEDSEGEVPQRLPPHMMASQQGHLREPEYEDEEKDQEIEQDRPKKKKWFGVI